MFLSKLFKSGAPANLFDDAQLFVIFGAMRSGSNLLQEKLNYFDDIVCLGELYNPKYVGVGRPHLRKMGYAGWNRKDEGAVKRRDAAPFSLLSDALAKAKANDKILGYRHFDGHDTQVRDAVLEHPQVRKVLLTRNLVDSFVSLTFARESGQWIKRNENQSTVTTVHFDIKDFEKYASKTKEYFGFLKTRLDETEQDYMLIDYEDVLNDERVTDVARHVGSRESMSAREPTLKKQTAGTISEKLSNYSEIEDYLRRCATSVF